MRYLIYFLIISCSADHDIKNINLGSGGQIILDNFGGGSSEECNDGDKRSCHITINDQNRINTCFVGIQICSNKTWSLCSK